MDTLAYADPTGLANPRGWRAFVWRNRIFGCFLLAILSGPFFVHWIIAPIPVSAALGPLRWTGAMAVTLIAQIVALVVWMGVAIGLLFDERRLTEAEELLMPLTLIVLVAWALVDVFAVTLYSLSRLL
jgi:hypothetical protein